MIFAMDALPIELLHTIARIDIGSYHALMRAYPAVRFFAKQKITRAVPLVPRIDETGTSVVDQFDYAIWFGADVRVKFIPHSIQWTLRGLLHSFWDIPSCTYAIGGTEWHWHGLLHRDDDKPAVIRGESQIWYQYGEKHRDWDRPADISARSIFWYQHGEIHRDDKHAAGICGDRIWYQHGFRHRDGDQPAVITVKGSQVWYQRGKNHRDGDQPAEIRADGAMYWYHRGFPRNGNKPTN